MYTASIGDGPLVDESALAKECQSHFFRSLCFYVAVAAYLSLAETVAADGLEVFEVV